MHAVRCIVVTNADETPDYLVVVIEDQTERYEAEDGFESAFNANPAPALICRISDLCFVRVNQGFLAMTGYSKEDVVGHSIYELDILSKVEYRADALRKLKEGETISQCEAAISLSDGSSKAVIVAGQPIEVSDEACMLFTFVDLEPRLRAEAALRQGEERFSKAFKLSPVASSICSFDTFQFIEVNQAFLRLTGHAEEDIIGRSALELAIWKDAAAQKRLLNELTNTEGFRSKKSKSVPATVRSSTACLPQTSLRSTRRSAFSASSRTSPSKTLRSGARCGHRYGAIGHLMVQPERRGAPCWTKTVGQELARKGRVRSLDRPGAGRSRACV